MKKIFNLLFIILPAIAFSQKTAAELAAGSLKACIANDQKALIAYMPNDATLQLYLKKLNPAESITKKVVAEAMELFTARTLQS